jgi:hypothetical protein
VLLGVDEEEVMRDELASVFLWFVSFCNKEVARINKLSFESIKPHFDREEKQAGVWIG